MTLNLLVINALCCLAQRVSSCVDIDLTGLLRLHYVMAHDFHVWQPISYMSLHGSFTHLFFNIFVLFMFGTTVKRAWGVKRLLLFYLVCGLTIALPQELVWGLTTIQEVAGYDVIAFPDGSHMATTFPVSQFLTVDASGAVSGPLPAFDQFYPNTAIYLFFIPIPIKTRYFMIGYGVIELFLGVADIESNVAHLAHLGGTLGGLLLILLWHKQGKLYNALGETYGYC